MALLEGLTRLADILARKSELCEVRGANYHCALNIDQVQGVGAAEAKAPECPHTLTLCEACG